MDLATSLTALAAWLAEHAPDTHATLLPGAETRTGSAELDTLYAWHAGQTLGAPVGKSKKPAPRPCLHDGEVAFELLAPADAAAHKAKLDKKLAKGGFDTERYTMKHAWHPRWLPFAFTKPDYLVVDLEGCFAGGRAGQILRVDPDSKQRFIVAPTLAALVAHLVRRLGSGAVAIKDKSRALWTVRHEADPDHPDYPIKKHVDQLVRVREVPIATKLLDVLAERMSASEVEAALAAGARLDVTNASGLTPLHLAAQGPNTAPLEAMLRAGASVDVRDPSGRTPLHHAVSQNYTREAPAMVRVLLRAGADRAAVDGAGTSVRARAADRVDAATRDAILAALDE